MSLILGFGSNLNDRKSNIFNAIKKSKEFFKIIEISNIYNSQAVDYLNQPDFLNCVVEYETPNESPEKILEVINKIESELGRTREINKGPRTIDIDILFIDDLEINTKSLKVPHPESLNRSFVVKPLMDLENFKQIKNKYNFKKKFIADAFLFEKIGYLKNGVFND